MISFFESIEITDNHKTIINKHKKYENEQQLISMQILPTLFHVITVGQFPNRQLGNIFEIFIVPK